MDGEASREQLETVAFVLCSPTSWATPYLFPQVSSHHTNLTWKVSHQLFQDAKSPAREGRKNFPCHQPGLFPERRDAEICSGVCSGSVGKGDEEKL